MGGNEQDGRLDGAARAVDGGRGEGTSSECGAWCDVGGGEGVSQDWVM